MPGDLPEVGVQLIAAGYSDYMIQIKAAEKATNDAVASMNRAAGRGIKLHVSTNLKSELAAIRREIFSASASISKGAVITFSVKINQAQLNSVKQQAQQAAKAAGVTGVGGVAGAATPDQQARAAAAAQTKADRDAAAAQRQADKDATTARREAARDAAVTRRADERARAAINRQERASYIAARSQMTPEQRMYADFEKDLGALAAAGTPGTQEDIRAAMLRRDQRYGEQQALLRQKLVTGLEKDVKAYNAQLRKLGMAQGMPQYVFQNLEKEQEKFFANTKATRLRTAGVATPADTAELDRIDQEYSRLHQARVEQTKREIGDQLRRESFEKSFMGQLAKAETRTYGARILAGEAQRFGAMMFGGGLGITLASQRMSGRYLTEFRQPLSRVSRALDLTPDMQESLDTTLLERAGRQNFQYASDSATAMRVWAEAINVNVDSQKDLLAVVGEQEYGLVAQTDMITNLVKLNEGTATLDQTVTDSAAIMTQFNLASEDAVVQTENLHKVVGLLDTAASSGLANINDIGSSLKFFAGRAYDLGIVLPEAVASVEMLAQVGLKGSQAGRGLDQLLKSVVAPTPKAAGVYGDLLEGVYGADWEQAFFNAKGEFKGLANYMQEMARATAGMSVQERQGALAGIGDANAVRTLNSLLIRQAEAYKIGINYLGILTQLRANGVTGIEAEVAALEKLTGTEFGDLSATDAFDMRLEHLREQVETLYSNSLVQLDTAMLQLGKSLSVVVVPALQDVANLLTDIAKLVEDNPNIAKAVFGTGVAGVAAGGALMAGGTAARGAIDLFTLYSAIRGTQAANAQGFRTPGALMGLNRNQTDTIVAAMQQSTAGLTDDELLALKRASGGVQGRAFTSADDIAAALAGAGGAQAARVGLGGFLKSVLVPAGVIIAAEVYDSVRAGFVKEQSTQLLESGTPAGRMMGNLLDEKWLGSLITDTYGNFKESGLDALADVLPQVVGWLAKWGSPVGGTMNLVAAAGAGVGDAVSGSKAEKQFGDFIASIPARLQATGLNFFSPNVGYFGEDVKMDAWMTGGGADRSTRNTADFFGVGPKAAEFGVIPDSIRTVMENQLRGMVEDMLSLNIASDIDAAMFDLASDGSDVEKIMLGLKTATAEFGAEMLGAGIPAGEVEAYVTGAAAEMASLQARTAENGMSLWELVAAAEALSKKLAEAAANQLAIQRLSTGETTKDFYETGFMSSVDLETAIEDAGKDVDKMYQQLLDLGVPFDEAARLKNRAISALEASGEELIKPRNVQIGGGMMIGANVERLLSVPTQAVNDAIEQALQETQAAVDAAKASSKTEEITEQLRSGLALQEELGTNVLSVDDLVSTEQQMFSDINKAFDDLIGTSFDTGGQIEAMRQNALTGAHEAILAYIAAIAAGSVVAAADAKAALGNILADARVKSAYASLESSAMTSDQRAEKSIRDQNKLVQESNETEEFKAQANVWATTAINNLSDSATGASKELSKLEDAQKNFVSSLRSMISEKISPSSGLAVTPEEMAKTGLGTYVEGAWGPLRRLASAATDPNTEWKDMLPPGMGVASPEAKNYYETVKSGVERFDPAYSAFFPDKGKIVEGVISDLDAQQRQEQFVTSVIEEMANMGYDKETLKKYFENPEQELEKSMGFLGIDVDGLDSSVRDATAASAELKTAVDTNTAAVNNMAGKYGAPPVKPTEEEAAAAAAAAGSTSATGATSAMGGPAEFARGGLVTKPTLAWIGEAGPELVIPLSRLGNGRGFVAPSPQFNMRMMAPQIGQINMNTSVTSPSPAFVAHTVSKMQRRGAVNLGREILRAATKEGY